MYVLGVDVGTTGTKAMLVDEEGKVVSSAYCGYSLIKGEKGVVEQNSNDWWKAFVTTVRECVGKVGDKHKIIAISMSTQGGSMVPVDAKGVPLSNAMVWMDFRGMEQHRHLLQDRNDEVYYRKTGWRLSPGLNLVKIKWIKDERNDLFHSVYKYLTTIDYINFKLTGEFVIDPTNGAMTQLMNINEENWDSELLDIIGVRDRCLPSIQKSCSVIGTLTEAAASELGLEKTVKVVSGAHDQYCAAVGAGAVNNGDIILSTGTAWVVLGISDKPLFDTGTYMSPAHHVADNLWGAIASIPTAGVAMEWFRENFSQKVRIGDREEKESFRSIDEKASMLMERASGLIFYPYFNGSGFPDWNHHVRGSFFGLGLEHDRYDMALAIMEGVVFQVKNILEEYEKKGCRTNNIRILGGASRSTLWTDIISNTVGCSTIRFNEANIACMGAAVIAGVGCGMFRDLNDGCSKFAKGEVHDSIESNKKSFYQNKYRMYKKGIGFMGDYYKGIRN